MCCSEITGDHDPEDHDTNKEAVGVHDVADVQPYEDGYKDQLRGPTSALWQSSWAMLEIILGPTCFVRVVEIASRDLGTEQCRWV
jgi:hypothetical protein